MSRLPVPGGAVPSSSRSTDAGRRLLHASAAGSNDGSPSGSPQQQRGTGARVENSGTGGSSYGAVIGGDAGVVGSGMYGDKDADNDAPDSVSKNSKAAAEKDFRVRWEATQGFWNSVKILAPLYRPSTSSVTRNNYDVAANGGLWVVAFLGVMTAVGHNTDYSGIFDFFAKKVPALVMGAVFCSTFFTNAFAEGQRFDEQNQRLKDIDVLRQKDNPDHEEPELFYDAAKSNLKVYIACTIPLCGAAIAISRGHFIEPEFGV